MENLHRTAPLAVLLAFLVCASPLWADGALGPENVAGQWGEGPDFVGNTSDDTWQYWFENQGVQNTFLELDTFYANPASVPNPSTTYGWVYHSDWAPEFEGVWGDPTNAQVYIHPYTHHGLAEDMAITYAVTATGTYTIDISARDQNVVSGGGIFDGVTVRVEKASTAAGLGTSLGSFVLGDDAGPASDGLLLGGQALTAGEYIRLRVDGNDNWTADMTEITSFKVYQGATAPVAPSPDTNPAPPTPPTPPASGAWVDMGLTNGGLDIPGPGPSSWSSQLSDNGALYTGYQLFQGPSSAATWYRGAYGQSGGAGLRLLDTIDNNRTPKGILLHDAWDGNVIEAKIYLLSFWSMSTTGYTDDNSYYGFQDEYSNTTFPDSWPANSGKVRFDTTEWTQFFLIWNNTGLETPQGVLDWYDLQTGVKPGIVETNQISLGRQLRFGFYVGGWTLGLDSRFDDFSVSYWAANEVPEPATLSLLALGAVGLLARRKTK